MHLVYFRFFFALLYLPRPARIAISKTLFKLRWVKAEHSIYCKAPISWAIWTPRWGVIGIMCLDYSVKLKLQYTDFNSGKFFFQSLHVIFAMCKDHLSNRLWCRLVLWAFQDNSIWFRRTTWSWRFRTMMGSQSRSISETRLFADRTKVLGDHNPLDRQCPTNQCLQLRCLSLYLLSSYRTQWVYIRPEKHSMCSSLRDTFCQPHLIKISQFKFVI